MGGSEGRWLALRAFGEQEEEAREERSCGVGGEHGAVAAHDLERRRCNERPGRHRGSHEHDGEAGDGTHVPTSEIVRPRLRLQLLRSADDESDRPGRGEQRRRSAGYHVKRDGERVAETVERERNVDAETSRYVSPERSAEDGAECEECEGGRRER